MKKFELAPEHVNQKSFYGKAVVTVYSSGVAVLKSYNTEVAYIEDGKLHRLWNGWSATTAKHVHEFCLQNGVVGVGKKEWLNLPVEHFTIIDTLENVLNARIA